MKISKWVGSKAAVADQILVHLPQRCERFVEPFAGTAVVGLHMRRLGRANQLYLGDINADLMNLWKQVRDHVPLLCARLRALAHQYNGAPDPEQVYLAWRRRFNERAEGELTQAALFVAINLVGYNGLFRVNSAGQLNVPWGKRAKIDVSDRVEKLLEASALVRGSQIHAGDYREVTPRTGDVVYCDCSYDGTYSAYDKAGWKDADLVELERWGAEQSRVCPVFMSNADTPRVREVFARHRIHAIEGRSCVSQTAGARGRRREVLVEMLS